MLHYILPEIKHKLRGYPRLDLVFFADGKHPFLADCCYEHSATSGLSYKLVEARPRTKYLRSLCIFILLAKYSRFLPKPHKGDFSLGDLVATNSWLATLGGSFGSKTQLDFFKTFFDDNHFVSCLRGTGHSEDMKAAGGGEPSSALYLDFRLRLSDLRCFEVQRFGRGVTPTLLEGYDLVDTAKTLESYWVKDEKSSREVKQFWVETVIDFAKGIKEGRLGVAVNPPKEKISPLKVTPDIQQPYFISSSWREFGTLIKATMSRDGLAGKWYAICIVPTWLIEWKEIFLDAITKQGAHIKFAYHSPFAGSCRGIKAQWEMYFKGYAQKGLPTAKWVRKRLLETRGELSVWSDIVKEQSKSNLDGVGTLEFYESFIPHPFMALLHTPIVERKVSGHAWAAPAGTRCALGLYSFYPDGLEERFGIFLNTAGPLLDMHYKAVMRFFDEGQRDKHIFPFPRRKKPTKSGSPSSW